MNSSTMGDYIDYKNDLNNNNSNSNNNNNNTTTLDINGNITTKCEVYDNDGITSGSNSIIGGNELNGIIEERVKVDRKRFEQMLNDENEIGCDAESFFKQVMKSTNTQIMWPPKLKPGTKSKKDPHVRITGSPKSINAAKEIIFEQLDTRRNRVTLKMDVAFTDHSHIIGKGGRSIQRVMDETGCHIHFPDSNRTSMAEKSNQVSIAGSAIGVEQSRCRIREMLPITLQFELPLNNGLHSPPSLDPQSPQLQAIQQNYGFTIAFRYENSKSSNSYFASSGVITVAVRGTRSHVLGLRQGINVLIEYLTGFSASSINVPLTMTIDVAVQHHAFIAGRSNMNIRSIMQSTGAVITMPDLSQSASIPGSTLVGSSASLGSPIPRSALTTSSSAGSLFGMASYQQQILLQHTSQSTYNNNSNNMIGTSVGHHSSRKTAICIRGTNFDSVYCAWQELLGYLPLILIFDLKEGQELDAVHVTQLMDQMRQISILIKPKQRQNTKSIVVRGPERDSRLLFEVRRQILNLDESEVPVCGDQHAFRLASKLLAMFLPCRFHKPPTKAADEPRSRPPGLPHPQQKPHDVADWTTQSLFHQRLDEVEDFDNLRVAAGKAMLDKPVAEKVRHPTAQWAGFGFSRSTSDTDVKQRVHSVQRSESLTNNASLRNLSSLQSCDNRFPASGPIDSSMADFLGHIGLIQYLGLLSQHQIDLSTLFTLTENDLIDLGLPFLHRRKLMMAMAELKRPSFEAAPGAERSRQNRLSGSRFGPTLLD